MSAKAKTPHLDDLKPAPYNPREIDAEALGALTNSLDEFGDIAGITWNQRTGHLVTGHQRLRVLREKWGEKLRMARGVIRTPDGETFRVRVVDWPVDREKAANVAANSGLLSGSFSEGLGSLLAEVEFDLPELFGDLRLDELLGSLGRTPEPAEGLTDPDDVPEERATKIKRGDLFELGRHRLLCGDATNGEDVGRVLGEAVPHLCVTDPPYGVSYDPAWRNKALGESNRATGRVSNDDIVCWADAYACFPGDVAYVWHASLFGGQVIENLSAAGFVPRSQIIWAKQHFAISRGHYHWQHECALYAVRKGHGAAWVGGRGESTVWAVNSNIAQGGGRNASEEATGHGTQKPVECMARPIRNHDAAAVYDPFCGSGTTIIAAEQLDRRCYAIEIEPRYCQVIIDRWQAFTGGKAKKLR